MNVDKTAEQAKNLQIGKDDKTTEKVGHKALNKNDLDLKKRLLGQNLYVRFVTLKAICQMDLTLTCPGNIQNFNEEAKAKEKIKVLEAARKLAIGPYFMDFPHWSSS